MATSSTTDARLAVISPSMLAHCLQHPPRGRAWSVRELAEIFDVPRSTLGNVVSGRTSTLSRELAHYLADATGVHASVLFAPVPA